MEHRVQGSYQAQFDRRGNEGIYVETCKAGYVGTRAGYTISFLTLPPADLQSFLPKAACLSHGFDLLLSDQATVAEQLGICILALLMGYPVGNSMTKDEYKTQLFEASYKENSIEIKEISEHVFAGLADCIEERDVELKMYLGRGIGSYKVFG